tara:strand:+ start:328 stop:516 length:189 start_codon:yes stop_codon:yes gene_type:complete
MAVAHDTIEDEFMRKLRECFTDAEIIELGLITGAFISLGRLHRALDVASMEDGAHATFRGKC